MIGDCYFQDARRAYHASLLATQVLSITDKGVPSNSDKDSKTSIRIAEAILNQIKGEIPAAARLPGQSAGAQFERCTNGFVSDTFRQLHHLRPGNWEFTPAKRAIARFEQYRHLAELDKLASENPELSIILGHDYVIAPDLVIVRHPEPDEVINGQQSLVDGSVAQSTSLRKELDTLPILHASISCKWTIRSDRAQNSRSEALNLIRNRKGRLPHVVVVTGEPLPSRLASLALGTGDLDCVYHFALYELLATVDDLKLGDTADLVHMMVDGKRLKDISDLPLDLAV